MMSSQRIHEGMLVLDHNRRYCISHGMRNEMDIWLKWLHRLTQCSRFFLARNQKYLCPMETGGSERMLLSQFTDELNLGAHPVGDPGFWLEPVVGTSENRTISGVNPPRQEMDHGRYHSISPVR